MYFLLTAYDKLELYLYIAKLHLHSVQNCTEVYMNIVRGDAAATIGYSWILSLIIYS